jgi:hypothetical protein
MDWTWDLSAFSRDKIKYRGLFPVQTVFRKWDWARIDGFNPVLPWGNEDWSFWIDISHLPDFHVAKIPEVLLNYRYKNVSMQREKELYEVEVDALMTTLHPYKYSVPEIIDAHRVLKQQATPETRAKVVQLSRKFPTRPRPYLWLGLYAEVDEDYEMAMTMYKECVRIGKEAVASSGRDWQPWLRISLLGMRKGTGVGEKEADDAMKTAIRMRDDVGMFDFTFEEWD